MKDGVAQAREFARAGQGPIVLADYSDRSGYATWLLREIVDQKLERTLIATIASKPAVDALSAANAKTGDAFDMQVGGLMDETAGVPVKIKGTIAFVTDSTKDRQQGQQWYGVSFGKGNVLIVSPYLVQIIESDELWALGLKPEHFDIIAIKSRAHFRRGFDDNGYAKQILLVEPDQPFMGTVHLKALTYENLRLTDFYPYGSPNFELRIHE
jgi:microcystin degradation protein MlrC